jgi:hypothetical protein
LQLLEDAVVRTADRAYQVAGRVRVLHLRESFELYLRTRNLSAASLKLAFIPPAASVAGCEARLGGSLRFWG